MLELVGTNQETRGLYAFGEECPQAKTVGVLVNVGGLDGLEDGLPVVFFGHFSPSLEIALGLLGELDGARPGFGRGDPVVEFSEGEPCHWNGEVQKLGFSC